MKVAYARVSSVGQNLDSQIASLKEYGCEKILQEKVSGTSTKERVIGNNPIIGEWFWWTKYPQREDKQWIKIIGGMKVDG